MVVNTAVYMGIDDFNYAHKFSVKFNYIDVSVEILLLSMHERTWKGAIRTCIEKMNTPNVNLVID